MGVVYKAHQKSLDRTVAIKMILAGHSAEDEFVTRFRGEAITAAALTHPNIVAVHEVGIHEGQHYFSMDYVSGRTLAEIVRNGPLPARQAAAYVRTMALAMQHAHQHGIMHRDLKPSNVVIDAADQPHITDFGLARQITGAAGVTLTGQVLGSVSYMPPEQAGAHGGRTGPQSDIYALGATLYHLVTGRPPFVGEQVADTLHLLMTADPLSIRLLNPAVPVDLETICLKCLEKQPERRYLTAQALADDLDRFLRHEPIQARAVGSIGRLSRWCRRKPLVAGLGATVAATIILGFGGIAWQSTARREAAAEAQRQGNEARTQRAVAEGRLYAAKLKLAHSTCLAGKTGGAMDLLRAHVPPPGATDFRGFEWRYLYRLCQSPTSEVLATNAAGYQSVAYSPDLRAVAFGTGEGFVEMFASATGERIERWHAHSSVVDRVAFLPGDSQHLVTMSGDEGLLKLWNVVEQRVTLSNPVAKGMLVDLAVSPSENLWVTRSPDAETVTLWEFGRGSPGPPVLRQKRLLSYHGPAAFAPDGRTLALANRADGTPVVALLTGAITELVTEHADMIVTLAFSADGRRLATGGGDERIVIWDVLRGAPLQRLDTDLVVVTTVAFDGRRLFASGWEQSIRSWDPASSLIQRHGPVMPRVSMRSRSLRMVVRWHRRGGTARHDCGDSATPRARAHDSSQPAYCCLARFRPNRNTWQSVHWRSARTSRQSRRSRSGL